MRKSIALCTYNGEKFLKEQLNSYQNQSRLPDELIVCDDCSTDLTLEILDAFAKSAPFDVKIILNERNLGYTKNFEKAVENCSGDIIFFSDQDDIWMPEKTEIFENKFLSDEKIGFIYANAEVVDETLNYIGTLWGLKDFDLKKQYRFESDNNFKHLMRFGGVSGSSCAFRAKYKSLIIPFPENLPYGHDNWTSLVISAVAKTTLIDTNLIKYRQHNLQASGGIGALLTEKEKPFSHVLKREVDYEAIIRQLNIFENRLSENNQLSDAVKSETKNFRNHIKTRNELSSVFKRTPKIFIELIKGNYHKYSSGYSSSMKDIVFGRRIKQR